MTDDALVEKVAQALRDKGVVQYRYPTDHTFSTPWAEYPDPIELARAAIRAMRETER